MAPFLAKQLPKIKGAEKLIDVEDGNEGETNQDEGNRGNHTSTGEGLTDTEGAMTTSADEAVVFGKQAALSYADKQRSPRRNTTVPLSVKKKKNEKPR